MEQGRLAEHIRKRAVCPRLFHENPQHERMTGTGRQTAVFSLSSKETINSEEWDLTSLVTTQETMVIKETGDVAVLAVSISNSLLSMFARPLGLMAEIILPLDFTEEDLRKLVGVLSEKCRELSMDLSAVDTCCENAVTLPIVTAFGVGERDRRQNDCEKKKTGPSNALEKEPEQYSIIMAGLCGAYGTKLLYEEEKIRKGFPVSFLKNAEEIFSELSVARAAAIMGGTAISPCPGDKAADGIYRADKVTDGTDGADHATDCAAGGCVYMRQGGQSGVFGALWELSEDLKTGFRVELEKIPLRQETIEFCERKDVSPYEIDAQGTIIGVTPMPGPILEALSKEEIPAEVIGYLTKEKAKCLLGVKTAGCEREIRFLDSPR